jgi:hypothetical protein
MSIATLFNNIYVQDIPSLPKRLQASKRADIAKDGHPSHLLFFICSLTFSLARFCRPI